VCGHYAYMTLRKVAYFLRSITM